MLLVFIAEPLIALPPLVLPLTLALPLWAFWLLLLETLTLLVLVSRKLLLVNELITLVEPGPVSLMESLPVVPVVAVVSIAGVELVTCTVVVLLLSLLASPLIAEPPLVLPLTLALPVLDD